MARASGLLVFFFLLPAPPFQTRLAQLEGAIATVLRHPFDAPLLLSSFLEPPFPPSPDASDLLPVPPGNLPSRLPSYAPPTENVPADPSNYGLREAIDVNGNSTDGFSQLVVLHETVGTADSALATFQNYHPRDADQVSYHSIIRRDGTVVYIVPEELRAFGAGNSEFVTPDGVVETVQTNPDIASSVNNFAYHVSLESPPDGFGASATHSGYTELQYQSLAWLISGLRVPEARITTHAIVDRGGERSDPRSFEFERFNKLLRTYSGRTIVQLDTHTSP